ARPWRAGVSAARVRRSKMPAPMGTAASYLRRHRTPALVLALVALTGAAVVVESVRNPKPPVGGVTRALRASDYFVLPAIPLASSRVLIASDSENSADNAPLWVFGPVRGPGRRAPRDVWQLGFPSGST